MTDYWLALGGRGRGTEAGQALYGIAFADLFAAPAQFFGQQISTWQTIKG